MRENNDGDELLIQRLKEGMNYIDSKATGRTPDISEFRKLVFQVEEKKQVKKRNEFFLFILSALLILSVETFAFSQSLVLFAAVQITAVLALPVSIIKFRKHGVRQVKPR